MLELGKTYVIKDGLVRHSNGSYKRYNIMSLANFFMME